MLGLRPLSWFPELKDSVLDFRAATTVLRATSIIILTGTIDIRTCTIIRMPGTHIHTIPRRPDRCGTVAIGSTAIIATTITTANNKRHSIKQLLRNNLSQLFLRYKMVHKALLEAADRGPTRPDGFGKSSAKLPRIHLARGRR